MGKWIKYFFGTPRRFLMTASVPAAVLAYYRPDVLQQAVFNLLDAVLSAATPFTGPLFLILLLIWGFKFIFKGKK